MATPAINQTQIDYWNEQSGPKWVAQQAALDRLLAPLGTEALNHLPALDGAKVLDVGCGCGATTLALDRKSVV